MITADQCRAARILTGMSATVLASQAGIGIATIKRFESGQSVQVATINAITRALSEAGITFIAAGEASQDGGDGVRLSVISPS